MELEQKLTVKFHISKFLNFISFDPKGTHEKQKGNMLWLAMGACSCHIMDRTDEQRNKS